MRKFKFQFESLLKYRRNQRDLCRQLLAKVLADDERLTAQRKALVQSRSNLLNELRHLGRAGEIDVSRSASRRYR